MVKVILCFILILVATCCKESATPTIETRPDLDPEIVFSIKEVNFNGEKFIVKLNFLNQGDSENYFINHGTGVGMDLFSIKLVSQTGMELCFTRKQYDLTGPTYRWQQLKIGDSKSIEFNLYDGTWNFPAYQGEEIFVTLQATYNGPLKVNGEKKNISYSSSTSINISPLKLVPGVEIE